MKLQFDHTQIIIKKTRKKFFITFVITIIIVTVIFIVLSGLVLANKGKIIRGLRIADISFGSLDEKEAQIKLEKIIEEHYKKDIVLRYEDEDKIWTALPEELGIKIDIDSTLARAAEIGHGESLFSNIGKQILGFFRYYNIPLGYTMNETELENFIREELNFIDNPAIDASWQYNKKVNNFVQIPSQQGTVIDREDFKAKLQKKMEKLTKDDIYLNLIYDSPEVLEDETKNAFIKAQEILVNSPYTLAPTQTLLTKEELIPMIEFPSVNDKNNPKNKVLGISLNRQALVDYLTTLSSLINQDPIDAQFTIEGDRVTNFSLSRNGLGLEIDKNIIKIREEILNPPTDEAGKTNKKFDLEVSTIYPKINSKNINNLGITSFIGKGVSNFGGSPNSRIHNIKIGATKFLGVLIKPGEEFSFNTILGEVGPEQGYKPELVIKRNKTVPEYGGGLCQVSTTTFRAAINSGLPIVERQPHAFPVKYYDPQGFDATIYPPHPDLRFINDTAGHLLIQTKIDGSNLTFEFYGTNDGRKVEIDGPHQYDLKPDGSMKAKFTRKILRHGELVEEKTFYSTYKSPDLYPIQRNPLE